jgi:hypothetical protein
LADGARAEWIFTFGSGHVHPETGERLANCYVRVPGDINSARAAMVERFGLKWAFQYATPEEAGVERYGLREIPLA